MAFNNQIDRQKFGIRAIEYSPSEIKATLGEQKENGGFSDG